MSRHQAQSHIAQARHTWLAIVLLGALPGCTPESTARISVGAGAAQFPVPADSRTRAEDASATPSIEEITVPEPSPSEPVTAVMTIRPLRAAVGKSVEVLVYLRIASAHIVHANDDAGGPYFPLGVTITLPEAVEPEGDWRFPAPETWHGNSPVYRNSVLLRRSLKVVSRPEPKELVVKTELRYQVCTEELCWPPARLDLSAPIIIHSEPR